MNRRAFLLAGAAAAVTPPVPTAAAPPWSLADQAAYLWGIHRMPGETDSELRGRVLANVIGAGERARQRFDEEVRLAP